MHANVGDEVVVESQSLGHRPRRGRVQEVLGSPDTEHFRVRWEDGRESVYYPGADGHVVRPTTGIPEQAHYARGIRPTDTVGRIMSTPVEQIEGAATLRAVATTLTAADIGALIVVENGTPLGMASERDVVTALAAGADPDSVWAADVASADTIWASPEDSIARIAGMMREVGARHIPVRDQGEVVGIVSMRDVFEAALDALPGPAAAG